VFCVAAWPFIVCACRVCVSSIGACLYVFCFVPGWVSTDVLCARSKDTMQVNSLQTRKNVVICGVTSECGAIKGIRKLRNECTDRMSFIGEPCTFECIESESGIKFKVSLELSEVHPFQNVSYGGHKRALDVFIQTACFAAVLFLHILNPLWF